MILGAGGDFFGLAQYGPGPVCGTDYGCGEIFRLTPSGAISAIYTFKAGYHLSPEGLNRQSGIFYGAAPSGDDNGRSNAGAVYRFAD